jgi:cell division protease FtsH
MTEEKKPDLKKNMSNSVILIVMGVIVALILVQNFLESKIARVSFSYQLEHLVNLDVVQPEELRKTASNNNLVTFSGKFREQRTEEGKNRYKYLELLDSNHELQSEKSRLDQEMTQLKKRVADSAELFLKIAGLPIPQTGFRVVDEIYDTPEKQNDVIITKQSEKTFPSLLDVEKEISSFQEPQSQKSASQLNDIIRDLQVLVRNLRSPLLGIGNEQMKQELRKIDGDLTKLTQDETAPQQERFNQAKLIFARLHEITTQLGGDQGHMKLTQLRSVRRYKDALDESSDLGQKIDDNNAKLEKARQAVSQVVWFFNNQELSTRALEKQEPEIFHQWFMNAKEEWQSFENNHGAFFKAPDQPSNKVLEKTFKSEELPPNYLNYLLSVAPIFLILLLLYFAFSRQMKGMGGSAMDFGKSPAKLYPKGSTKVTFKDVAGIDEALEELQEIVEFLKNPQKFTALGGRIPKGVLCIGSPGTGKTLVAKAVAGEADCPFFSISGSDFVEMFVGVGASRIRKMFEEAKKSAPCIIFMDEIDAVGRHRGAGMGGGHDEREQTLNQLLVEMDGFDTNEGIIMIAATNRPDVLDKALLRPGRFDRQVYIPLPDIKGRFDILKVHARKIKLDASVDLMTVARSTPGCSGADLQNLLNEAALLAARKERSAVTSQDVFEARDKVLYGKERRNMELDEQEKKTTAYHESGHTIVGARVKHADPIDKVTIIPRGFSLGSTMFLPKKNRVSYWKSELLDQLAVLMGGRAAEEIFLGDVSSGAKQDIERATQIARSMVCEWGMSDALGAVTYDERSEGGQFLGMSGYKEKLYSEETAEAIDKEVRRLLDEGYAYALEIIRKNRDAVELMAQMLIEFETLDAEDVAKIVKGEWKPEEKREKLTRMENLNKKDQPSQVPPPPPPFDQKLDEGSMPPQKTVELPI